MVFMKQNVLKPGPLLDCNGELFEAGYCLYPVKTYDRQDVRVKGMRIKEWDYYYVGNDQEGVALTVADNDYLWLVSVTCFDFNRKSERTRSRIGYFSRGKLQMPNRSDQGDVVFERKGFSVQFRHEDGQRRLIARFEHFDGDADFSCDITLKETIKDSLVIATPFKKKRHFYYNQKINLLKGSGRVRIGDRTLSFADGTYGVLDWGRGVWTYKNTWYWASMSGEANGNRVGFNLGYGFGDTTKATENIYYCKNSAYKLDDVVFDIPKTDFLKPWKIYSKSGDIDLEFVPILDRHADTNALVIRSNQHQVFGYFSGTIGPREDPVSIDHMLGFAEKVMNRW
jgi:hypothetical protein